MATPHRRPRHKQHFLPGYSLHEAVELHPIFDGEENLDGYIEERYTEEILMVKLNF